MAMAIHFIFKILDLAIRLKKWPFVFLAIRLPGVFWPSPKARTHGQEYDLKYILENQI